MGFFVESVICDVMCNIFLCVVHGYIAFMRQHGKNAWGEDVLFVVRLWNIVVSHGHVSNMRHRIIASPSVSAAGLSSHRSCLFLTPYEFPFTSFLDFMNHVFH